MKLTVLERINLLSILPSQGNLVTLRILRELRDELSFTEREMKRAQIQILPDGKISFEPKAAESVVKDIHIGDVANGIIVDELVKAEKAGKLKALHLDLYERFVSSSRAKPKQKPAKKRKKKSKR